MNGKARVLGGENPKEDIYWFKTEKAQDHRPLASEIEVDTVVIGGGFTGVSAAYFSQTIGAETALLEKSKVGSGASGRNGGHLLFGSKYKFSVLAERFGSEFAGDVFRMSGDAFELIEGLIREYSIDCSLDKCGNLWAAHKPADLEVLKLEQAFLAEEFGYETRVLEKAEMDQELRSEAYHGVHVDPHGASFHPLNYVLGLANAFEEHGGMIFEDSAVVGIEKHGARVVVRTMNGQITATNVIIATNAYTPAIFPDLASGIVAVRGNIIVTEALAAGTLEKLIPGGRVTSDTKKVLNYFRPLPGNRMLFGGRGDVGELYSNMEAIFPDLSGTRADFSWAGSVAITRDAFPHIGRTSSGFLFAAGYNGRGAALSTLLGKLVAQKAHDVPSQEYALESLAISKFPFHQFREFGVKAAAAYFRFKDRL